MKRDIFVWKFIISGWVKDVDDPALEWSDCFAAAIAHDQQSAMSIIERAAAEVGADTRWLKSARVIRLPVMAGTYVGLVMA